MFSCVACLPSATWYNWCDFGGVCCRISCEWKFSIYFSYMQTHVFVVVAADGCDPSMQQEQNGAGEFLLPFWHQRPCLCILHSYFSYLFIPIFHFLPLFPAFFFALIFLLLFQFDHDENSTRWVWFSFWLLFRNSFFLSCFPVIFSNFFNINFSLFRLLSFYTLQCMSSCSTKLLLLPRQYIVTARQHWK